jgi:hypothetical protein
MIKVLTSQLDDTEKALEASELMTVGLSEKRDALVRQLADEHIKALSEAPAEVRAKVIRYFREIETGTKPCPFSPE